MILPNICEACDEPFSDGILCRCERPISDSDFDAARQAQYELPADPDAAEQLQAMEDAAHWHGSE